MCRWSMGTALTKSVRWAGTWALKSLLPDGNQGGTSGKAPDGVRQSPRYAEAYRALEWKEFDTVYPLVMGYIRDRFLLDRDRCRSDRLLDLADASLRYLLELKRMGIDLGRISRSCAGASSVITKKVLLMKAVQDVFNVTMTPEEFAHITTVTELTHFICGDCQKTDGPQTAGAPQYCRRERL